MARFLQSFTKKRPDTREPPAATQEPGKDPYDLFFCNNARHDILSNDIDSDDVFAACRSAAVRHKDFEGAVRLLLFTSHAWRQDLTRCLTLDKVWEFILKFAAYGPGPESVLDIFALAEKDQRGGKGDKSLTNFLVERLLKLPESAEEGLPVPAKQLALLCLCRGYYAFGFDIALSSENYDEAFSILTSVETKGEEFVWMLLDVASRLKRPRAVPFIDHCRQRQRVDFAFSLATCLKLWPRVVDMVQQAEVVKTSLLQFALGRCVSDEKWDVVRLLLDRLSEQEVFEELLLTSPRRINASAVVDLLLERGLLPRALKLACSFRLTVKAAQIMRKDFVMDRELSDHVAKACFDNLCGPDQFLGLAWSEELLKHVLDAPRRKPFSENQWKCVMNLVVEPGRCPRQALLALMTRAVHEDAACLPRFIGRGVDEEMLQTLLAADPDQDLSDSQLGCVTALLYREAGLDLKEADGDPSAGAGAGVFPQKEIGDNDVGDKNPSDEEGSCVSRECSKNEGNGLMSGHGDSARVQADVSELSLKGDWSTAVPDVEGVLRHPWGTVMRAAQRARHSRHLRQLAIRAAHEGQWNCLICLAMEGLHQHPLDLFLSLLHAQPESLVLSYLRQREEQGEAQLEDLQRYQLGWRKPRHDLDVLNLQSRGLLEERHRRILLKRAVACDDWHTMQRFASLDLPLSDRRAIFVTAMDKRQWTLAMDVFDQLPDRADPDVFRKALDELGSGSSDVIGLMKERGLYNPYFALELATDHLPEVEDKGGSQEKGIQEKGSGNAKAKFWSKFTLKSTPRLPINFRKPTPPVGEEKRGTVTPRSGKAVERAARKGDWGLAMTLYEGGMGEAVKTAVLRKAVQQGKWPVVTTLIRRDPEAKIVYRLCRQVMEEALSSGAWSVVEAVAETLATQDDRDWLLPYALDMRRWCLVLELLKRGVSTELRDKAAWSALEENEWTFVMAFVLMTAGNPAEGLNSRVKEAVVRSMMILLESLQTPAAPGTTFGKNLFKPFAAGRAGQGRCWKGDQGQDEVTEREGRGGKSEEVEEGRTGEFGATALHLAARLGLWTVCRVLLHCGVRPHPTTTTTPGLLQLALRHDASEVLHMLLDLGASGEEDLDGILGELLLTHDLGMGADDGFSLLCKLLDSGADPAVALRRINEGCTVVVEELSVSESRDDGAKRAEESLKEQVSRVLAESSASTFQPTVAIALKSGRIVCLAPHSQPVGREGTVQSEADPCSPAPPPPPVPPPPPPPLPPSASAGAGRPQTGPRVPLRVDRERLAAPTFLPSSIPHQHNPTAFVPSSAKPGLLGSRASGELSLSPYQALSPSPPPPSPPPPPPPSPPPPSPPPPSVVPQSLESALLKAKEALKQVPAEGNSSEFRRPSSEIWLHPCN